VIESLSTGPVADHQNPLAAGSLPDKMKLKLIEPLRLV
jgi:GMP synthase PP-ATPase subunit